MSKEKPRDQVLGHADEADGIEEYDNPMPGWWLGLFYFTIIWAIGYSVHYHFIADRSQPAELAAEMLAAETRWHQTGSTAPVFTMTDEAVAAGREVFAQNCASCHGQNLEGGIGPNLLDDEWIHGDDPEDVINTITHGVLERGMLAWESILGAERINQVAAYVLSRNAEALEIEPPSSEVDDDGHGGRDEDDEHGDDSDGGEDNDS